MKHFYFNSIVVILVSLFAFDGLLKAQNIAINGIQYAAISDTEAICYGPILGEELSWKNVDIRSSVQMEVDGEKRNYTVRSINSLAFMNCTEIVSVSIPSTIKTIENYAFAGCKNLENVWLSTGLESIGNNAFEYTAINR